MRDRKAVVLLSGGLDSATALAVAQSAEYECYTLSFDYNQRHKVELNCAKDLSATLKVKEHKIVKFDMFGGSALNDSLLEVPKGRALEEMIESIPITYVPARNTIFLAHALSYAEVLEADTIFTGVNVLDYSGYPDCRPEYIEAFERVANLATKRGVEGHNLIIETPLINLTKVEIIQLGTDLGVPYNLTSSCYDPSPDGKACGKCDSCLLRKQGFQDAGVEDPTRYMKEIE